jgi:hypothetical protein
MTWCSRSTAGTCGNGAGLSHRPLSRVPEVREEKFTSNLKDSTDGAVPGVEASRVFQRGLHQPLKVINRLILGGRMRRK